MFNNHPIRVFHRTALHFLYKCLYNGIEVKKIMDEDPGVQAGVFVYEIHATRSFPGDSLPKKEQTPSRMQREDVKEFRVREVIHETGVAITTHYLRNQYLGVAQ
jgi:hypothetical protein